MYTIDNSNDGLTIMHRISQHKLREMQYCKIRPYMLVDKTEFSPNIDNVSIFLLCFYGNFCIYDFYFERQILEHLKFVVF